MKALWWSGLVALLPVLAAADDSPSLIDFDRLFADFADRVETVELADGTERRILMMPGPVRLSHDLGTNRFVGLDESGLGAVGCAAHLVFGLVERARACPRLLTPAQHRALSERADEVITFMAENAYPPIAKSVAAGYVEAMIDQEIDEKRLAGWTCPVPPSIGRLSTHILSDAFAEELTLSLALPRLPVVNPCL
ncbi:MAG TPA: hypothetical protein DDY29_06590 [Rhodobacteraceae bacterium]|jgi:hypothetical protein|nr:hypothetical protein [Paracoccaceae bacterium]HBG98392.1 hypothetical protein [Paracoccaceae bacterium]